MTQTVKVHLFSGTRAESVDVDGDRFNADNGVLTVYRDSEQAAVFAAGTWRYAEAGKSE